MRGRHGRCYHSPEYHKYQLDQGLLSILAALCPINVVSFKDVERSCVCFGQSIKRRDTQGSLLWWKAGFRTGVRGEKTRIHFKPNLIDRNGEREGLLPLRE